MKLPNQVNPITRTTLDDVHPSKINSVNPQGAAFTTNIPSTAVFFPGFLPEFGFSSLVYCLPGPGPGGFQCVFLG
jgi:hypothetical protein